jgi:hypothetical protein
MTEQTKFLPRKFEGIRIPAEIWRLRSLTAIEKVFYVEIVSLDATSKGCRASNAYFSKFFNLSKSRCSEIMSNLEKYDLISIDYVTKNNYTKCRIIKNKLSSNAVSSKVDAKILQIKARLKKHHKENNISIT